MKFKVNDWVVPVGQKVITQIEEIESWPDVVLAYTSNRKAYPLDQLMTVHEAYEVETANK